jgi:Sigma 54 modulation protein / S30EA ribosomal protein
MQVLLNTDHSVTDFDTLNMHVDAVVSEALNRHREHITRVEVHIGDENGKKSGPDDKRCMMEARLDRRPPVAVTHHADSVESAVHGAARSLAKAIEKVVGRSASARETHGRAPAD